MKFVLMSNKSSEQFNFKRLHWIRRTEKRLLFSSKHLISFIRVYAIDICYRRVMVMQTIYLYSGTLRKIPSRFNFFVKPCLRMQLRLNLLKSPKLSLCTFTASRHA